MALIDREKLKEAMCESCAEFDDCAMTWPCPMKEVCLAMHTVDTQPEVDPVKRGWWNKLSMSEIEDGIYCANYECSICHNWARINSEFCPKCGARMDLENK